ncbi:MAG: HlyD family secretion protein, partial [Lentisphaerae bacterium]|nr:HlyD family secretion protein [Lentisphaerota bacterium]
MKLKNFIKPLLTLIVLAAAAAVYFVFFRTESNQNDQIKFKTEPVVRTTIQRTIAATGTVEPEELINVGAQVNGKIMSFGKDADGNVVDYGSRVTAGMILAQIDDVTYKAELQEVEAQIKQADAAIKNADAAIQSAEAAIQSAEAGLKSADAAIAEAIANEALAQNNWARAQELYPQGSMTRSDYDSYQAALNTTKAVTNKVRAQQAQAEAQKAQAQAQKAQAEAQKAQAEAQKSIAEAALVKARRNLEYCTIVSPVDGVVIDRRVSVGQTVVSNQTASSIFLVARDFKKMQVWVSVNEADVGAIKPGMKVVFTCDAFPNTEFHGVVNRLRLNATLSSNVVTYVVEVNADNADGKLIPYLTANVKFIRAEERNTLAVPVSALRYTPPEELQIAAAPEVKGRREGVIWVKENDKARPVKVTVGISNNVIVAVKSDELKKDMLVITGVEQTAPGQHGQVGQADEKNP